MRFTAILALAVAALSASAMPISPNGLAVSGPAKADLSQVADKAKTKPPTGVEPAAGHVPRNTFPGGQAVDASKDVQVGAVHVPRNTLPGSQSVDVTKDVQTGTGDAKVPGGAGTPASTVEKSVKLKAPANARAPPNVEGDVSKVEGEAKQVAGDASTVKKVPRAPPAPANGAVTGSKEVLGDATKGAEGASGAAKKLEGGAPSA